jgi:outer membrane lipoprotein-sorting protein
MKFIKNIFPTLLITLTFFGLAQQPNKILSSVYTKLNKAKDYTVDVNVKVDLPFIKMLPINAKIYFKQKDKIKVDSKSIAIIPKQGFDQLTKLIADTNSYTAIQQNTELVNNVQTTLISIIPANDTSDIILGKIWVDEKQTVIAKSLITTKSNGTILTEYTYGTQIAYGLPDKMMFEIDIKKFKIPKSIAADIQSSKAKTPENTAKKEKKGKIFITLNNYTINKGIDDKIFKK